MKNAPTSTMSCQCSACLDQLASPQWLWFHEQQHHANHKIIACPHCDTILPTKAKYFPTDNNKTRGQLLRCPSCNRQDQLKLFLRRQTAFACGFCSASFYTFSPSPPSSSPHASGATTTLSSSSGVSDSSRSHSRTKHHYFRHLAAEFVRNDELTEQGQPPREWNRDNIIYGLLQRPEIAKHWRALAVRNKAGGSDACKIPAEVDAFLSWDMDTDELGSTATNFPRGKWNLQSWLQYFDLEKDGDEKAANVAALAFAQAGKMFRPRAGRVEASIRTNEVGSVGNKKEKQGGGEEKVGLNKPLPQLPIVSAFSPSSTMPSTGLKSTDCRRDQDNKRREKEVDETRRKVRHIAKQIEMALSAAYC